MIYILSIPNEHDHHTYDWLVKHKFYKFCFVVPAKFKDYYAKKFPKGKLMFHPDKVDSLSKAREWLLSKHKENVWVIMACDNITKVTGAIKKLYSDPSRKDLANEYSPQRVVDTFNLMPAGSSLGLVGFASNSNHYFRKNQFSEVGFVWGKLVAMRSTKKVLWRHDLSGMEDYAFTAEYLKAFGKVLILKWTYAHDKKVKGYLEVREKARQFACKKLVEEYKGLYRYKERTGHAKNSELQMRFHSVEQIAKWRMQFTNLKSYVRT